MSQATKHDRLRDAFKNHKILADTCFLMHRSFGQFLEDYAAEFQDNRILVPRKVVQELQRIEKKNDHRLQAVRDALRWIEQATSKKIAEIRGEQSDDHTAVADHVISRVVEQHIAQHSILVLTNDRRLRDWIYAKKRAGCFSSRNSLLVVRFGPQNGTPHIWGQHKGLPSNGRGQSVTPVVSPRPLRPRPTPAANLPQPFARTSRLEGGLETLLHAKEDVENAGCVRLYNGQQVRLSKKLASGGEGTVYETDQPGILCKIYHPNRLTDGARRKIELMVTRRVTHPAICWPTEAVRDSQGVFRGFLMPRATGEPLGHGLFIPTVWLSKRPNWTRKDSVRLTISILEGINYLHRMKVLLGDINPMNILVQDASNVFFVDCDSYQVEGFPCPVGSINFVAAEIQGQDFARFLRTPEHELFAVATLAFMIMMPGKPPYSHQGGEDGAANIKKMHFPYPLGEKGAQGAPEGAWRFCWSHLTRPIKEAFHQVFHADFQGQPRITVSSWLRNFRTYERNLGKPTSIFTGPTPQYGFDLSILPHNFRYLRDKELPLPTGGETDLQRSVKKMASASKSGTYCSRCKGRGTLECPVCKGDRNLQCDKCQGSGEYQSRRSCPKCYGSGDFSVVCRKCNGSGWAKGGSCWSCDGLGRRTLQCKACDGQGYWEAKPCNACSGAGSRECYCCHGDARCPDCQPRYSQTTPTLSSPPSPSPFLRQTSAHPSSGYPGAGEWYSNPLLWPVAAPVKAILEAACGGVVGAIVGAVVLGSLLMMFGNYDGFGLGAMWGAGIGTFIGLIVAGATINKVDSGIFAAGGIGIVVGALAGGILGGSSGWAITCGAIGMVLGLLVRHLQIGERKAAEYMHSWWGK